MYLQLGIYVCTDIETLIGLPIPTHLLVVADFAIPDHKVFCRHISMNLGN